MNQSINQSIKLVSQPTNPAEQSSFGVLILPQAVKKFSILSPDKCLYIVKHMYVYTCIYVYTHITHIWLRRDCKWITVATKQYCEWNILTQIECSANCWLDINEWGAGLGVTGWIRDIGQNVFTIFVVPASSYCQTFFLIAFLEGALIRNNNKNMH